MHDNVLFIVFDCYCINCPQHSDPKRRIAALDKLAETQVEISDAQVPLIHHLF